MAYTPSVASLATRHEPEAKATWSRGLRLGEFRDSDSASLGEAAAVSLDPLQFVHGFRREVSRAAVRAANHWDVLDNQQTGTPAVASGQMSDFCPATTAVLASKGRPSFPTPHRPSECTGCQAIRTWQRHKRHVHQVPDHGPGTSTRAFHGPFVVRPMPRKNSTFDIQDAQAIFVRFFISVGRHHVSPSTHQLAHSLQDAAVHSEPLVQPTPHSGSRKPWAGHLPGSTTGACPWRYNCS